MSAKAKSTKQRRSKQPSPGTAALVPVAATNGGDASQDVQTRHGGVIPDSWATAYRRSHTDHDFVSLQSEIGLVDAQIAELTAQLQALSNGTTAEGKPLDSREAGFALNLVERGLRERDKAGRDAGIVRLRSVIESVDGARTIRAELRELIALRRRLCATQASIAQIAERFVPFRDFRKFAESLAQAVLAEVDNDSTIERIRVRLGDLLRAEEAKP